MTDTLLKSALSQVSVQHPLQVLVQHLEATKTPINTLDYGVGINWFDFLGAGGVYGRWDAYPLDAQVYPPLEDALAWKLLLEELSRLNPGFIRFGIPPDSILDADGHLLTDSVHILRLEKIANWCQAHGAALILDPFVIPARFEFAVPEGVNTLMVNMAAKDNSAYAREFVAPLLHHLVVERGLEAIKFFNPINEPINYGVYQTAPDGPDVFKHYVEMYSELRLALNEVGLQQIGLIGIDKDLPFDFPVFEYLARGIDIDPSVAAYSIHSYRGRFDYAPETAIEPDSDPLRTLVDKFVKRIVNYCESRGKPLLALEVGSFYYGQRNGDPSGPASLEGTLLTAETILRMINVGIRGALIWSPMNPNDIDGWWRMFDVQNHQVIREAHTYPTFYLLMKYARRGSQVHPLVSLNREYPQYVCGSLMQSPDGHTHIFVINDHPNEARQLTLNLPDFAHGKHFHIIRKDRTRLGETDGALHVKDLLEDTLAPMSMQVYTTDTAENCL
jgi:hypothetical protein